MSELAKVESIQDTTPATINPVSMIAIAVEKGVDSQQLKELMALEREWREDKARAAFAEAMAEFNQLKKVVTHNKSGKTAGSAPFSYADYGKLVNAVTPWLGQCGLSFSHRKDKPVISEKGQMVYVMVYCRVLHKAGHFEETEFMAFPDSRLEGKVSPSQLVQLAVTYAKRQTLSEALGLATSDDKHDDDSTPPPEQKPGQMPITDAQKSLLLDAMNDAGVTEQALCKIAGVSSIDDIIQSRLAGAKKWIADQKSKGEEQ